jgi:hypothetical protein
LLPALTSAGEQRLKVRPILHGRHGKPRFSRRLLNRHGYATTICLRHINTLQIFNDSLNNNKIITVINADTAFEFSKIYFKGHVIKNTDGGMSVINLKGV